MPIRTCPDCRGTGKHFVPPSQRESWHWYPDPHVSSTAGAYRVIRLPEYCECLLCCGTGEVECVAAHEIERQTRELGKVCEDWRVAFGEVEWLRALLRQCVKANDEKDYYNDMIWEAAKAAGEDVGRS